MDEENEIFWKSVLFPIHCSKKGKLDACNDGTGLPCCFLCPKREECLERKRNSLYEVKPCLVNPRYNICGKYVGHLNGELNDKKP
jgi:hypothetical protein